MFFPDIRIFLETFKDSQFEFSLRQQDLDVGKVLSYQSDFRFFSKLERDTRLFSFIKNTFPYFGEKLDLIRHSFSGSLFHIGIDISTKRLKLYISLYEKSVEESLMIVQKIQTIFHRDELYKVDPHFIKFDCVGIDFSSSLATIKVYELLDLKSQNTGEKEKGIIREIGILKSLNGRKKIFVRFAQFPHLDLYSSRFQIGMLENFQQEIKDFYILKKKVKYYCTEGDKKEIYFI